MRVALPGRPHLSYCTNIHPGETLADVRDIVGHHVAAVKARVSPTAPFGVGLRLSARAAEALSAPGALDDFRALLFDVGAYVFSVNGFPYGSFHGTEVKERVYQPDWTTDARVVYSDRLARILAALLPDGVPGSVSTVPGTFGPLATDAARAAIVERLFRHASALFRLREETGKSVEIALEPEPSCMLETVNDACRFFERAVFSSDAVAGFARQTGLSPAAGEAVLRRHVGVCLDACHAAVEFEDARSAVRRLQGAGIRIGKIQVTDALIARFSGDPAEDETLLRALERYSDGVYLHQVVERRAAELARYLDLPDAIRAARAARSAGPREWRIHFHVPVFLERLGPFASTQPFLRELFGVLRDAPVTEHLEVETYTWDVLPEEHREGDVDAAIARELEFVLGLASRGPSRENAP